MTNINVSYITETTQPYVAGSNPLDIAEDWSQGLLPANKAIAALVQYINNTEEAIQELDDCRKAYRQQLMQIVSNFESATYTTDDGVTVGVIQPYGYYRYNKDDVDDVVEWLTLMRLALGDDGNTTIVELLSELVRKLVQCRSMTNVSARVQISRSATKTAR